MRTPIRLVVSAAVLGGGLLLAGPAAAQTATPCPYPADKCPTASPTTLPSTPPAVGGGGGGPAIVDQSPVRGNVGGAASLPFTGGEVTMIALAGTATLGAGVALVVAGRRRATV